MNFCNCGRLVLVNVLKSQSTRVITPLIFSTARNNVFTKCFSLNHGRILNGLFKSDAEREEQIRKVIEKTRDEKRKDSKGRLYIYKGLLQRRLKVLKVFSMFSGVTILTFQIFATAEMSMSGQLVSAIIGGALATVPIVLMRLVAAHYVTDILYEEDSDRYTAVTYSLFGRRKEMPFFIDDVEVPKKDESNKLISVNVIQNGIKKPLFFDQRTFIHPMHYDRLVGTLKPAKLRSQFLKQPEKKN